MRVLLEGGFQLPAVVPGHVVRNHRAFALEASQMACAFFREW